MALLALEIKNIRKAYGDRELFHIENLTVYEGERIGLVGRNGAGKSTLLHILAGGEQPDEGTVRHFGKMAEIRQQGRPEGDSEGLSRALFRARDNQEGLSGGEQTRNRIAAAFSGNPRLLLADEPTTDLDEEGLIMLRRQLEAFEGTLILISHDRSLLRQFCTRIWHLENGCLEDYPCGYDEFEAERDRRRERAQFEYDRYRTERKRLEESARRMAERASSVKKAPSRMGNSEARLHTREYTDAVLHLSHMKKTIQKRMDRMEEKERPTALPDIRMKLGTLSPVRAKTALEVRCERMSAGGVVLLEETGFSLPAGSKTALTGSNGCGKTTLLSALTGQMPEGTEFSGTIRFNPQVRMGWFDQHHERTLRPDKTVLENITEESVQPRALARTVLSCLGFEREDAFKPVSVLSGGEKAKAALARLLLMDLNLLILDEPTNHLDLFTLKALEDLLSGYGGTLLFVSHDRALIKAVADRIIRMENGNLVTFEGGLEQMEADSKHSRSAESIQLEISALEMRMAALAMRMSAPKKGDQPDQMNAEYNALAVRLRELKN